MEIAFDERIARTYDDDSAFMFADDVLGPTVDFLAKRADGGMALEFGIGTGRVALPLSASGVEVHGIDVSRPMLDRLRSKPGGESIAVVEGSFADTRIGRSFDLVYLVYNTITNLTTQDEQLACFRNAARHLKPGGCFVIEVFVPRLRALPPGERVRAFHIGERHVGFDEYIDFTAQVLRSHHYWNDGGAFRRFSALYRWAWPSELDLMAKLAGLTLSERYGGWQTEPFTDDSTSHVSVWWKPGPTAGERGSDAPPGSQGMADPQIRKATVGDLQVLVALDTVATGEPERRARILRGIDAGAIQVLEADGRIRGYALMNPSFYGQPFIELVMIGSHDRGRGYGPRLIAHLVATSGNRKLFTSTNESNTHMQHVLERLGFQRSGIIHNLDPDDPEVVYCKPPD